MHRPLMPAWCESFAHHAGIFIAMGCEGLKVKPPAGGGEWRRQPPVNTQQRRNTTAWYGLYQAVVPMVPSRGSVRGGNSVGRKPLRAPLPGGPQGKSLARKGIVPLTFVNCAPTSPPYGGLGESPAFCTRGGWVGHLGKAVRRMAWARV